MVLDGTVRARSPRATWAALELELERYGITRMARLTGLDYFGVPVWTAIRPGSHTLVSSQGKGATDLLAKISAAMEAIELWYAEQQLTPALRQPAQAVELPYPLAALPLKLWHDALVRVPLDWALSSGITTGHDVPVPLALVQRSATRPTWQPDIFRVTSTGLACGNSRDEAMLHGMYEVVERDALFTDETSGGAHRGLIDPRSVDDPYCRELIAQIQSTQADLELAVVRNAYGIPVCLAYLWSEDYPVSFAGAGCHTDPHIALSRAITEAVQSRLTCIAGTRDDLVSHEEVFAADPPRPPAAEDLHRWYELTDGYEPWHGDFTDQARAVAARIEQVTSHEPLCLDLSDPSDPLAAVKVICPGTKSRIRRSVPR